MPLSVLDLMARSGAPAIESLGSKIGPSVGDARAGLNVLIYIIIILLVIAVFFVIAFIYRNAISRRPQTTLREDYRKEAEDYEKAGRFVSAAAIYESQLKEKKKAAELYEKGTELRRAAILYDLLGMSDKAKEMYQKDGDIESAAEVAVFEGNYEDAAKLYDSAGKKIDAAMLLEKAGRRMAAVRAYREAGEYKKAAQLLEEEGLLKEAAEMFSISLGDRNVEDSIDDFYAYALKLERAGEARPALGVFIAIDRVNPLYRDVKEKLASLAPSPPKEEDPGSRTLLRSFIRSGKIEPGHALKLWVHILKALQEAYKTGKAFGSLSPDTIAVDPHNNISFLSRKVSSVYASPESLKGFTPDACSDVYSAGVILYELLMGNLDGLGLTRITDTVEDVPEWLDEIALRCARKVREDRYQSIELIFSDIKALSREKKSSGTT